MARIGKRLKNAYQGIDRDGFLPLEDALRLIKSKATAKFDETIELAMNLGIDPRHADQMVRGTVNLPHGTGKTARVIVFATGDKAREAESAGADVVGSDDLIERIRGRAAAVDAALANPEFQEKARQQALPLSFKSGADWQADMPVRLARYTEIFKLIDGGDLCWSRRAWAFHEPGA